MNKYDVEKVVGQGSYGKALLCKRKSDKKACIIKQISLRKLSQREAKLTEQESSLLARLNHPNIVTFWESFKTNETNTFSIVMEFADGGDLSDLIKNRKSRYISEQKVLDIFIQISLAIKHIHDRKILHRDLKSQNVFLTSSGMVKLGDFGVSRVLRNTGELASTQIGTPYYMSPEIMDNKRYNSKTDIWSLGCILYELMCLKLPFSGQSMAQLVRNIISQTPATPPSNYSKELRDLVKDTLTKNPKQRSGINTVLQSPVIKNRISTYLNQSKMQQEFSHTILHGVDILAKNGDRGQQIAVSNAVGRAQQSDPVSARNNGCVPVPNSQQVIDVAIAEERKRNEALLNRAKEREREKEREKQKEYEREKEAKKEREAALLKIADAKARAESHARAEKLKQKEIMEREMQLKREAVLKRIKYKKDREKQQLAINKKLEEVNNRISPVAVSRAPIHMAGENKIISKPSIVSEQEKIVKANAKVQMQRLILERAKAQQLKRDAVKPWAQHVVNVKYDKNVSPAPILISRKNNGNNIVKVYKKGIVLSGDERIPNSSSSSNSSDDDISSKQPQARYLNQAPNQIPNKLLQRHEASVQQQVKQNNQIISELNNIGKEIKPSIMNKDISKDIKEVLNKANRDKEIKEQQAIKDNGQQQQQQQQQQQPANIIIDFVKDAKQVIRAPVIKNKGGDWFNNLAYQMGELKDQIQDLKIKSPLVNNDNQSKESFDIDIISKISPYEQRELNKLSKDIDVPVPPSLNKSPSAQLLKPPLVPKSNGNSKASGPIITRQSPVPFTSQSSSPLLMKKSRKSVNEKTNNKQVSPTPGSNNLPYSREQLQQRREMRIQKSEELKEFIKLQREEIKNSPSVVIKSPPFVDVDINSIIDEDKAHENFNFIPMINDIALTPKLNSKINAPSSGNSRVNSTGKQLSSSKSPKNSSSSNSSSKKKIQKSVAELKAIHDAERIEMKLQMKLLKKKNDNNNNNNNVAKDNLTASNRVNIDLMSDMNAEDGEVVDFATLDEILVIPLNKSDYSNISRDKERENKFNKVDKKEEEVDFVQINYNNHHVINNKIIIENETFSNKGTFVTQQTSLGSTNSIGFISSNQVSDRADMMVESSKLDDLNDKNDTDTSCCRIISNCFITKDDRVQPSFKDRKFVKNINCMQLNNSKSIQIQNSTDLITKYPRNEAALANKMADNALLVDSVLIGDVINDNEECIEIIASDISPDYKGRDIRISNDNRINVNYNDDDDDDDDLLQTNPFKASPNKSLSVNTSTTSLEYSILLQQMQAIMQLPLHQHNRDNSNISFINPPYNQSILSGINEDSDNNGSDDDDEFDEEEIVLNDGDNDQDQQNLDQDKASDDDEYEDVYDGKTCIITNKKESNNGWVDVNRAGRGGKQVTIDSLILSMSTLNSIPHCNTGNSSISNGSNNDDSDSDGHESNHSIDNLDGIIDLDDNIDIIDEDNTSNNNSSNESEINELDQNIDISNNNHYINDDNQENETYDKIVEDDDYFSDQNEITILDGFGDDDLNDLNDLDDNNLDNEFFDDDNDLNELDDGLDDDDDNFTDEDYIVSSSSDPLKHSQNLPNNIDTNNINNIIEDTDQYNEEDRSILLWKYLSKRIGEKKLAEAIKFLTNIDNTFDNTIDTDAKDDMYLIELERIVGSDGLKYLDEMFQMILLLEK